MTKLSAAANDETWGQWLKRNLKAGAKTAAGAAIDLAAMALLQTTLSDAILPDAADRTTDAASNIIDCYTGWTGKLEGPDKIIFSFALGLRLKQSGNITLSVRDRMKLQTKLNENEKLLIKMLKNKDHALKILTMLETVLSADTATRATPIDDNTLMARTIDSMCKFILQPEHALDMAHTLITTNNIEEATALLMHATECSEFDARCAVAAYVAAGCPQSALDTLKVACRYTTREESSAIITAETGGTAPAEPEQTLLPNEWVILFGKNIQSPQQLTPNQHLIAQLTREDLQGGVMSALKMGLEVVDKAQKGTTANAAKNIAAGAITKAEEEATKLIENAGFHRDAHYNLLVKRVSFHLLVQEHSVLLGKVLDSTLTSNEDRMARFLEIDSMANVYAVTHTLYTSVTDVVAIINGVKKILEVKNKLFATPATVAKKAGTGMRQLGACLATDGLVGIATNLASATQKATMQASEMTTETLQNKISKAISDQVKSIQDGGNSIIYAGRAAVNQFSNMRAIGSAVRTAGTVGAADAATKLLEDSIGPCIQAAKNIMQNSMVLDARYKLLRQHKGLPALTDEPTVLQQALDNYLWKPSHRHLVAAQNDEKLKAKIAKGMEHAVEAAREKMASVAGEFGDNFIRSSALQTMIATALPGSSLIGMDRVLTDLFMGYANTAGILEKGPITTALQALNGMMIDRTNYKQLLDETLLPALINFTSSTPQPLALTDAPAPNQPALTDGRHQPAQTTTITDITIQPDSEEKHIQQQITANHVTAATTIQALYRGLKGRGEAKARTGYKKAASEFGPIIGKLNAYKNSLSNEVKRVAAEKAAEQAKAEEAKRVAAEQAKAAAEQAKAAAEQAKAAAEQAKAAATNNKENVQDQLGPRKRASSMPNLFVANTKTMNEEGRSRSSSMANPNRNRKSDITRAAEEAKRLAAEQAKAAAKAAANKNGTGDNADIDAYFVDISKPAKSHQYYRSHRNLCIVGGSAFGASTAAAATLTTLIAIKILEMPNVTADISIMATMAAISLIAAIVCTVLACRNHSKMKQAKAGIMRNRSESVLTQQPESSNIVTSTRGSGQEFDLDAQGSNSSLCEV